MNQDEATRVVNELFDTLAPFLMRFALRGTRSAETAEDLVQEVFMALYRDLRNGKQIDDLRARTIGAVRNQYANTHARRGFTARTFWLPKSSI